MEIQTIWLDIWFSFVGCWLLYLTPLVFFLPNLFFGILFVCEGRKKITKGKKKGNENRKYLLNFYSISGFNNHSVGKEIIPETNGNVRVSQTRC